jgi:hypothetical protein
MEKSKYINEFAEKWIQALESGGYEQATGKLGRVASIEKDGSRKCSYCCLGVASVLDEDVVAIYPEKTGIIHFQEKGGSVLFQQTAGLLSVTQHKLGLRTSLGEAVGSVFSCRRLSNANDRGMSFKGIAAVLRERPELFFIPIEK